MDTPDLKRLFKPRGLAVIGASHNPGKIGYKVVKNIIAGGYSGGLYPVNPAGGELLGLPVFKNITDIREEVDVAVIAVPAGLVRKVIPGCAERRVKFLTVISSGFSEIGNQAEERRVVSLARRHNMRLLGPNVLGYYSAAGSLNATFGPARVLSGGVAIISQSGALGIALMGKTVLENMRLSAFFSIGNKADLDEADLLEYLGRDPLTRVILLYLEGVKNGARLIARLKEVTRAKPVIMLKAGRSRKGSQAAASHTGALAAAGEVFDAVMRQCGALTARTLREALDWGTFLTAAPQPVGEDVVIVTNGGGLGVLAADAAEQFRVKLYDDIPDLKKTFAPAIPEFGSFRNPVDLTAGVDHRGYGAVLRKALKNRRIHGLVCLYCQTATCDIRKLSEVVKEYLPQFYRARKPFFFAPVGDNQVAGAMDDLRRGGVAVCEDPHQALSCLGALYEYHRLRESGRKEETVKVSLPAGKVRAVLKSARAENRKFLLSGEAGRVMDLAGIPVPATRVAHKAGDAAAYAAELGFPVVVKVVSRDIIHKTEAGGVLLNLRTRREVARAYRQIIGNCRAYNPEATIDGVEVSEMVRPGIDMIAGARRDSSFGPLVMCGLGGIYVETFRDVSFRAFPATGSEIEEMLHELRSAAILEGTRGERPKDMAALVETIMKLGEIIRRFPLVSDIEINPLVIYEEGVKAVDVKVLLAGE